MTFKERTLEFNKIAEELRQKKLGTQGGSGGGRDVFPHNINQHSATPPSLLLGKNGMKVGGGMNGHGDLASSVPKSQFALVASQLGKQIQETAQKLSKLTALAKKNTLFDYEKTAGEINHLTLVIKQDIQNLNGQIEALQNHVRSQKYLKKNQQTESHASSIVNSLKSQLANTTKRFQKILETRTENMKKQQEKRQQFEGVPVRNSLEVFKPRSGFSATGQSGESSIAIGLFDAGGSTSQAGGAMVPWSAGGGQQQQQSLLSTNDSYIASRAVAVENIEQTIVELQGIFTQLATIVAEQGEMMQRIDANIEDARSNVEGAQGELLKYLQGISGNKWLIIKIFLVLIVFVIIFVVFFV